MKNQSNKLLTSVITIVLGVLLMVWKTSIISIAITLFGVYLIILGILDLVNKKDETTAIIKLIVGVAAILLAWLLTAVAVITLGVILMLHGITLILDIIKANKQVKGLVPTIMLWAVPVISIAAGLFIAFGSGMDWAFIVVGVIVIIEGMISLVQALTEK